MRLARFGRAAAAPEVVMPRTVARREVALANDRAVALRAIEIPGISRDVIVTVTRRGELQHQFLLPADALRPLGRLFGAFARELARKAAR